MKARMITRCGCERTINVSYPPPLVFVLPLTPRIPNEGHIREWMNSSPSQYDPVRDGLQTRKFQLSLESLECVQRWPDEGSKVWYDEISDYDPPAFNADKRTYAKVVKVQAL